jgi:hypothetical protein
MPNFIRLALSLQAASFAAYALRLVTANASVGAIETRATRSGTSEYLELEPEELEAIAVRSKD